MTTLIVFTGPTAVGKTALTIRLAQHYGIDIINADSRQIYRELKIGTASPTEEQLRMVPHHFVGSKSITDYYNASMYEQDVLKLLKDSRSDISLLSGGSMMYIDAVCNGIDDIPTIRDDIREMMKMRLKTEGLDSLCDELQQLDPEHYDIVDRKNYRRVIHALEICHQTGRTYTSFRTNQKKARPFNIIKIGLNREREELYNRINARANAMIESGLVEEVNSLGAYKNENALNTVGYKEIFAYLDGKWTLEEAVERMKGNTRRYARKQLTWFKRDPQIRWFHPNETQQIINYINEEVHRYHF